MVIYLYIIYLTVASVSSWLRMVVKYIPQQTLATVVKYIACDGGQIHCLRRWSNDDRFQAVPPGRWSSGVATCSAVPARSVCVCVYVCVYVCVCVCVCSAMPDIPTSSGNILEYPVRIFQLEYPVRIFPLEYPYRIFSLFCSACSVFVFCGLPLQVGVCVYSLTGYLIYI